jgi:EAL domain-containing protein (putative c-di-GMP-specific phosphodiesterase class I)
VRADLAVEAAIRTGRADDLTRRTLQAALELIEKLEAEGRGGICVSVNLNEAQLMAPGFLAIFDEVFGEADQASGLIVEMMEGDYLGSRALTDIIAALRARRSALAIDDFGRGHSSLLRLFAMPSHIVKLDRALLQYREQDPGLLAGMISALGAGGRLVVVEGVETEEDAEFLRRTGAGLAQGYHFARPMPLEEALHAVVAAGHGDEPPICQPRTGARSIS